MMGIKKIIFTLMVLAAVFTVLLIRFPLGVAVPVTLFAALLALLFFALNYTLTNDTKPPDIFADTRRNFRFLLLGSTRIWKNTDVDKYNLQEDNRLISFAFYKRNLYADSFILQRMFSYLDENGTVIITLDLDDNGQFLSEKLTYADYRILHPLTMQINNFRLGLFQKKYPLVFHPFYSTGYLIHKTAKKIFSGQKWRNKKYVSGAEDNVVTLTNQKLITRIGNMVGFCYERGLDVRIACILHSKDSVHIFREIKDRLKVIHPQVEIFRLNSSADFEKLLTVRRKNNRRVVLMTKYLNSILNFYLVTGMEFLPYAS